MTGDLRPRSWLFAPGHDEKLLDKVFDAGADRIVLDLEDAVPLELKARARALVAEVAKRRRCWVRVNVAQSDACRLDLETVGGVAAGVRVPKVESAADVAWVAERVPGLPLDCMIESARGVLKVQEIAAAPACTSLAYGGIDLARDLDIDGGELETLYARSRIVLGARAAWKPAPSDGVHPLMYDDEGLLASARAARRLGFFGKSAIHPRQVAIIHEAFSDRPEQVAWARRVVTAFEASGGAATRLPDGEFVDLPVAERARQILSRLDPKQVEGLP